MINRSYVFCQAVLWISFAIEADFHALYRGADSVLKFNCIQNGKALFQEAETQMPKGAFLMVQGNPMTIGWCQFGVVWGKPICTVFVRKSRYSHSLIEKTGRFTVSVPKADTMKEELAFCGKRSGRDTDKMKELGLSLLPAAAGGEDGLAGCSLQFECRVVFKTESELEHMDADYRRRYYGDNQATPDGDPHTVYFGEILAAYRE